MKLRIVSTLAFAALTLTAAAASAHPRPQVVVDFRTSLAPYGHWAAHPNYGQVYYPTSQENVPDDCQHYGNWVQTTSGWGWTPGYEYHAAPQNPYAWEAVRRAELEARRAREEAERARAYQEWRHRQREWRWRHHHRWDERDGWGR